MEVVRSAAGSGKTFALDAAREAWQASGVPVLGCALSARAACELRDQAAVEATTIARLTRALDLGIALAPGTVLLVDEAGMVGTRALAPLVGAVTEAEGKLVLVGDDRQLPEIEAGGLFAALADRLGALELREVRRQREPWDREALVALRDGDLGRFAREYAEHGRIVTAPTAAAVRGHLVDDWLGSFTAGERAVMIANRRRDVAELNRRARERLRASGRLGPHELIAGRRAFAVGDRVVARRNARTLGVVNGDAGHVTAIDEDASPWSSTEAAGSRCRRRTHTPATSTTATRSRRTWRKGRRSTVPTCSARTSCIANGATPRSRATGPRRASTSARRASSSIRRRSRSSSATRSLACSSRAARSVSQINGLRATDPLEHFHRWPERPRRRTRDLGLER